MTTRRDYRFWLVFAALAVAVLVACSSTTQSGGADSGGAADSMTQS
jgi:hypothetical protein